MVTLTLTPTPTLTLISNLFFDSESRAVQASSASDEDTAQAQNLATTAKLMQMSHRMQTTDQTGRERPAASGGVTHVPPPMPPQLFTWCENHRAKPQPKCTRSHKTPLLHSPERQTVVPGVRPPEARSDLVDLMRTINDHSKNPKDSNTHV